MLAYRRTMILSLRATRLENWIWTSNLNSVYQHIASDADRIDKILQSTFVAFVSQGLNTVAMTEVDTPHLRNTRQAPSASLDPAGSSHATDDAPRLATA